MKAQMARMDAWGRRELGLTMAMWAVMMVAMMVPSAAPMILLFGTFQRKRKEQHLPYVPTGVFLLGYLAIWTLFAVVATLAQLGLHTAALLSPMMVISSPVVGAVLLALAGIYQWTPFKEACLKRCRTPLDFIADEWREGTRGAFVMGVRHGLFCTGCCALLMGILFVAGVMNLLWVALLGVGVLLEKVLPAGRWAGRLSGASLLLWAAWMLL